MKFLENIFSVLYEVFNALGAICWSAKEILQTIREAMETNYSNKKG